MNLLYAILMRGTQASGDYVWYHKESIGYIPTERMQAIRDILMQGVGDALPMVACQVCAMVLYTQFGTEIKALDSNNTYTDVTRPPDKTHDDPAYCMYNLIKPADAYKQLRRYLDEDIVSRADLTSWLDIMAAGCLQMLREATKV